MVVETARRRCRRETPGSSPAEERSTCRASGALRQIAAQLPAALLQIADFRRVVVRLEKGQIIDIGVRERNAEAGAELQQGLFVELLLLVGDVQPSPLSPSP
jgi:hypothetical protein